MSNNLSAIIVDDEDKARNMLQMLLTEHCPHVTVLAHCSNVPDAAKAIQAHKPDIVFLDVDMPGYTGFELLDFIDKVDFEIIFTTAYSEYAIRAFRVSALDYLMKPINIKQLVQAVHKANNKRNSEVYQRQLQLTNQSYNLKPTETIAVSTLATVEFINLAEITYLQADSAYTRLVLLDGTSIVASKNIKEFEEILENTNNFMRIHRSYIVNTNHVARYNKQDGGFVEMKNGQQLSLSKNMKDEFIARMSNRQ